MTPRRPAPVASLLALLSALAPRAVAAPQACAAPAVESDPAFRNRFPDLLERVERELSGRSDIDACARIDLRSSEGLIVVAVTLPDGRAASRSLARREDVLPSLQALLLVPAPTPAPPPVVAREGAAPNGLRHEPREHDAGVRRSNAPARHLGFELSVISGVRMGDGQFGYGVGLLSLLEVKRWLLGFEGRADSYQALRGGDAETVLELALLGGRRINLESTALDITVGPGIAMRGATFARGDSMAVVMAPASTPRPPPEDDKTGPMPRLLLGARLGFRPRSVFRTFVGVDGEVGPRDETPTGDPPNSARIPTFSVGLALGATVGTP